MPIDKKIVNVENENGLGDMEFSTGDPIFNNIFISSKTRKGSRLEDPNFGSRFHELRKHGKITDNTLDLAKEYGEECIAWMIEIRRIKSVKVTPTRNSVDLGRIDLRWDVVKADGQPVKFNTWYNVI